MNPLEAMIARDIEQYRSEIKAITKPDARPFFRSSQGLNLNQLRRLRAEIEFYLFGI